MLLLLSTLSSQEPTTSYGDVAAVLLSKFVQARSINHPGHEMVAAEFLERVF